MTGNTNKADTVACEVWRDFWDEDGVRHESGKIVDLPTEKAMDMIEIGAVSRVKVKK